MKLKTFVVKSNSEMSYSINSPLLVIKTPLSTSQQLPWLVIAYTRPKSGCWIVNGACSLLSVESSAPLHTTLISSRSAMQMRSCFSSNARLCGTWRLRNSNYPIIYNTDGLKIRYTQSMHVHILKYIPITISNLHNFPSFRL